MRIAVDPEVLLEGVLTPHAAEGRLLDLTFSGGFVVLQDDRVVDLYRRTLSDPALELPIDAVDQLVESVARLGWPVTPSGMSPTTPVSPLIALAVDGCADALVVARPRPTRTGSGGGCGSAPPRSSSPNPGDPTGSPDVNPLPPGPL